MHNAPGAYLDMLQDIVNFKYAPGAYIYCYMLL